MNFPQTQEKSLASRKIEPFTIQLEDLNSLITAFKRREENIIQILDSKVKFKRSKNQDDVIQIQILNEQISEIEETRIEKENQILIKYSHCIVFDPKQKRLIERLVSKIIQINTKVREKLVELNILEHVGSSLQDIPLFEDTLTQYLNQTEFNIEVLMTFVAISSRLRLQKERQVQLKKSEQLFYEKMKQSLQDLIKSNRIDILHGFKVFSNPSTKPTSLINPPNEQDFNVLETPSYPLTTYTYTHPNKSPSKITSEIENSIPSSEKSMNQFPIRPSSANLNYNNSITIKRSQKVRHGRDMNQRNNINSKNEELCRHSVELYKGFVDSGIPNLAASLNKDTLSIREKLRNKKLKSLNLNEKVSHTFDFNTQESENQPNVSTNHQRVSTSYEKVLKVEAANVEINQNKFTLDSKQEDNDNNHSPDKQLNDKEELSPLKLDLETKHNHETFLNKRKKSPSPQKTRDLNLKILNSFPKNIIQSQTNESPLLMAPEISNTSIKVLNILRSGKGFSREDMINLILESKEVKEGKPYRSSYYESWRNYDVMNIEYRPLMVTKKIEAKIALMERVYNDLMYFNFEIKKSTSKFYTDFTASKVINQPSFIEQSLNDEAQANKNLEKKAKKLNAKIPNKSRRSISIDNSQSRRISRGPVQKLGQEAKSCNDNNMAFMRGSVPQVNNTFQRTMFGKAPTNKLTPKLFILPKLNVVDTSKVSSEMPGNSLIPFPTHTNINFKTTGPENRYGAYQASQVINSKEIDFKKISYENNLYEQKGLSMSPSAHQVPKNRMISNIKADCAFGDFVDDNYYSFLESGNCNEQNNTERKTHLRKNILNETLKSKSKGTSSRYETPKELPEIKGRVNKLSIEFCKPYPESPDNMTKNYPLKINLQR